MYKRQAEFIIFVLLVNVKSFCDFVYTSAAFAFIPIAVLSVDILLVNVVESAFNAIAVLRVFKLLTVVVESVFKVNADCVAVDIGLQISEILSILPNPTIDLLIPCTVPVNTGLAILAF